MLLLSLGVVVHKSIAKVNSISLVPLEFTIPNLSASTEHILQKNFPYMSWDMALDYNFLLLSDGNYVHRVVRHFWEEKHQRPTTKYPRRFSGLLVICWPIDLFCFASFTFPLIFM